MSLHAAKGEDHNCALPPLSLLRGKGTHFVAGSDESAILLVDTVSPRRHSLAADLRGCGHRLLLASTVEQALQTLQSDRVSLVVTDLMAPDMPGLDLCRAIRGSAQYPLLPVIAIGRRGHIDDEVLAMEAGADVFFAHNVDARVLRSSVQSCLRRKATIDQLDETETVLFTLAQSVEQRDPALGKHCDRMAGMAATIGMAIGLNAVDILALQRGGYLHDVGKVAIPDSVLFKPGPLNDEEWTVMKSHAERGERICRNVRSLAPVLPIIRNHHERWDGSGYPDGLAGEEIPLLARVIQLTDIYDALTTARPYKRAYASAEAVGIMQQETDKGWRDPKLIKTFVELLPLFTGQEQVDVSQFSLQALGSALAQYRREPAREEAHPVRMVSGL